MPPKVGTSHEDEEATQPQQSDEQEGSKVAQSADSPSDDEDDKIASLEKQLQELKEQKERKKQIKREGQDRENKNKTKELETRLKMGQAEVEGLEDEYQRYKRQHEKDIDEIQQALRKKEAELHDYRTSYQSGLQRKNEDVAKIQQEIEEKQRESREIQMLGDKPMAREQAQKLQREKERFQKEEEAAAEPAEHVTKGKQKAIDSSREQLVHEAVNRLEKYRRPDPDGRALIDRVISSGPDYFQTLLRLLKEAQRELEQQEETIQLFQSKNTPATTYAWRSNKVASLKKDIPRVEKILEMIK